MRDKGFLSFEQEFSKGSSKGFLFDRMSDLPGADESWAKSYNLWIRSGPAVCLVGSATLRGGFRFLLIDTKTDYKKGDKFLGEIKTVEDIEKLFRTKFPDIFLDQPIPEFVARKLLEQKPNHGSVTTCCSAFHPEDSVVLVGDSAHSVRPNAGQGCQLGLESCAVLAGLIEEHDGDLSKALPAFTAVRKPEADAVAAMPKPWLLTPSYFAKTMLLNCRHKLLLFEFGEAAEDRMATGTIPYTKIAAMRRWQFFQLKSLLAIAVATAGFPIAKR